MVNTTVHQMEIYFNVCSVATAYKIVPYLRILWGFYSAFNVHRLQKCFYLQSATLSVN